MHLSIDHQWRTVGFWRPGQEVESAPLFPDFFSHTKKSKMVDLKLISAIFKSEMKKKNSYIFPKFERFARMTRVYTAPRATLQDPKIISLI